MPLQHRCAGTLLLLLLTSSNRRGGMPHHPRPAVVCHACWPGRCRYVERIMGSVSNRVRRFLRQTVRAIGPNAELAISILFSSILCSRNGSEFILGLDRGADCGEPCLVRYWRGCSQLCRRLAVIDVSSFERPMNSPTWILRLARELPPGPPPQDVISTTPKRYTRAVAKAAVAAPQPESGSCTSKFIHASFQHRSTATRPHSTRIASARLQATTTTKQPPANRDVLLPHRSYSLENGCELARIGQGFAMRCQCQNAAVSEASCSEPSLVRQPWRRADQGDKLRLSKCGCPARARGPKKNPCSEEA